LDIIADIVELKKEDVEQLFAAFEHGKAYFDAQTRVSSKKMMKITDLTEEEVLVFMKLLKEKK
jgi:hypothetical protein